MVARMVYSGSFQASFSIECNFNNIFLLDHLKKYDGHFLGRLARLSHISVVGTQTTTITRGGRDGQRNVKYNVSTRRR